jgi:transcriptional regulator with XRE-family HTH domain
MKVSEILKELRKNRGLTQKELSEKLKIGQATIAGYENGSREPHIYSLIAYANFFECSVDYLLGREDDFGNVTVQKKTELTEDEKELLEVFRKLNAKEQMRVLAYEQVLLEDKK